MRLLISGYYGFGNAGDEAVLAAMVEGFRRHRPRATITVLSASPAETARLHGVGAIPRFKPGAVWRGLRSSDLLVSGGGSLLQDVTSRRNLAYYTGILALSRLAGTPFVVFAQGMGPVRSGWAAKRVAGLLSAAQTVTVRDRDASDRLAAWGFPREQIHVTADAAFALRPRRTERVRAALQRLTWDPALTGPVIGISLRPLPGGRRGGVTGTTRTGAAHIRLWAMALDRLVDRLGARLLLLPMQSGTDEEEAARVLAAMKHARMKRGDPDAGPAAQLFEPRGWSDWPPAERMALVGELDAMVAMRYHALVFAALQGVPAAAVPYDPKVAALVGRLGGAPAISCWDRTAAADRLLSCVEQALSRRKELGAALSRRASTLREEAERTVPLVLGGMGRQSGTGQRPIEHRPRPFERRVEVLGLPLDLVTHEAALRRIASALSPRAPDDGAAPKRGGGPDGEEALDDRAPYWVVTANPELVRSVAVDGELSRAIVRHARLVVSDGIGLLWGARLLGVPVPERIPGVELAEGAVRLAAERGARVFLLGGRPGVADDAARRWRMRHPGLDVVGTAHGYFTPGEGDVLAVRVQAAAPHLILVALGASRQERWIAEHLDRFVGMGTVVMGVGGTLDVVAGRVRRAPGWVRKLGLEWCYRLARQPARITRMGALPWFVGRVLSEKMGGERTDRNAGS